MEYIKIGFVGKTHGLKGELKLSVEEDFIEAFNDTDAVFVEVRGQKTPFFIEGTRSPDSPIIKFEEIDTKEAALPLQHKAIYLKADAVTIVPTETVLQYGDCVGFVIVDAHLGALGEILSIEEFPQQEMAILNYNDRETFIPLNSFFIKNIDTENRQIAVDLPEGLLDLS
jgi:16S rRNA processing protein RimM